MSLETTSKQPGKSRVAIITDSIACLTPDMVRKYGIYVLAIHFYHGHRLYADGVDITPSQAYQLLQDDPKSFRTSAVSPGESLELFRRVAGEYREVLCITLSSKLSAVYNVTCGAREQLKTERPDVAIEVLDSNTATAAEGFVVLAAARAAAAGKSLPEVIAAAQSVRDKISLIALMGTVRFAYRTGRIPRPAAQIGSILNIKPIFSISGGTPHFITAVRNREAGIEYLVKSLKAKAGPGYLHVAVMHAYAPEEAERLKERIAAEFNPAELWTSEFSPIMGYATGPGTLGLAFYCD